jgi:hypothetical protein
MFHPRLISVNAYAVKTERQREKPPGGVSPARASQCSPNATLRVLKPECRGPLLRCSAASAAAASSLPGTAVDRRHRSAVRRADILASSGADASAAEARLAEASMNLLLRRSPRRVRRGRSARHQRRPARPYCQSRNEGRVRSQGRRHPMPRTPGSRACPVGIAEDASAPPLGGETRRRERQVPATPRTRLTERRPGSWGRNVKTVSPSSTRVTLPGSIRQDAGKLGSSRALRRARITVSDRSRTAQAALA